MTRVESGRRHDLKWVGWTAAAMGATLWHALIDQHIGLNGPTSDQMSLLQAGAGLLAVAVAAWWVFLIAESLTGRSEATRALLLLIVYRAVLMNGVVAFAAAPPPSAAFPYQDMAHGASLLLGLVAAHSLTTREGTGRWGRRSWVTLALLVADSTLGGLLMVSNL